MKWQTIVGIIYGCFQTILLFSVSIYAIWKHKKKKDLKDKKCTDAIKIILKEIWQQRKIFMPFLILFY